MCESRHLESDSYFLALTPNPNPNPAQKALNPDSNPNPDSDSHITGSYLKNIKPKLDPIWVKVARKRADHVRDIPI